MPGALTNPDVVVCALAAHGLGLLGPRAVFVKESLRKVLEDDDPRVRLAAAEALWKVTAEATLSLPVLLELFDDDEEVVTAALSSVSQIWITVSVYLLDAIVQKRLVLDWSPSTILQIRSVSIFEKTPWVPLFSQTSYKKN